MLYGLCSQAAAISRRLRNVLCYGIGTFRDRFVLGLRRGWRQAGSAALQGLSKRSLEWDRRARGPLSKVAKRDHGKGSYRVRWRRRYITQGDIFLDVLNRQQQWLNVGRSSGYTPRKMAQVKTATIPNRFMFDYCKSQLVFHIRVQEIV